MANRASQTAALAGIPAGLQAQGVWAGRRQLFVRFAMEAETATMYTSDALANELKRSASRSSFHSISISGRDPLAYVDYLTSAFEKVERVLPVMLDGDGQRPEAVASLASYVTLVQVTLDGLVPDGMVERALETLRESATARMEHALVIGADERMSDAQLMRLVEQAHGASDATQVVIHPGPAVPVDRDRRWITVLERATGIHSDVRIGLRLPPPTGMR